jgi:hypothetical protein
MGRCNTTCSMDPTYGRYMRWAWAQVNAMVRTYSRLDLLPVLDRITHLDGRAYAPFMLDGTCGAYFQVHVMRRCMPTCNADLHACSRVRARQSVRVDPTERYCTFSAMQTVQYVHARTDDAHACFRGAVILAVLFYAGQLHACSRAWERVAWDMCRTLHTTAGRAIHSCDPALDIKCDAIRICTLHTAWMCVVACESL